MGASELDVILDVHPVLGEGPSWDARDNILLWVDIPRGAVHRYSPSEDTDTVFTVGQDVGAIVPRRTAGYALAVRDGFALVNTPGEEIEVVAPVERDVKDSRMNDGKVDPRGRFWAGTMAENRTPTASLYRLDPDGTAHQMITGVSTSNGMGWSLDGTRMYYIDSPTKRVDVLDFDMDTGAVRNRRPLIDDCPQGAVPDGMTVDADGCLWVAYFRGWCVRRYTPVGVRDRNIACPVSRPTSCAFGGHDLSTFYITSDARNLPGYENESLGGALFALRPGVSGLPTYAFAR